MTASTSRSNLASVNPRRFIVAVQNAAGGWQKIGFVAINKRCSADAEIKKFFPVNTAGYKIVLKSCRWLTGEKAANWVEWERRGLRFRTALING